MSLRRESRRRSIGQVCSRDDTDLATVDTVDELSNGLEFRVIEGICRGVDVDVESIDGALFSSVKGSGGVGRVADHWQI